MLAFLDNLRLALGTFLGNPIEGDPLRSRVVDLPVPLLSGIPVLGPVLICT